MSTGRLLLVPNALDLGAETVVDIAQVLPLGVLQCAAGLGHWLAEDARSTRAFLKRVHAVVPLSQALQTIDIRELPRPPKGGASTAAPGDRIWRELLQPALNGQDIGLISEAGLPAVADPGAMVVAAAHGLGVIVLPLPGASSLLLALAASGLNGQSFAFVGYLPQDAVSRSARLKELQALSRRTGQTQLLIETPYRNATLLKALLDTLGDETRLSVSCGLSLPSGWTRTERIAAWRQRPVQMPDRVPAVFAFLAD